MRPSPGERRARVDRRYLSGSLGGRVENSQPVRPLPRGEKVTKGDLFAWGTVGSVPPLAVDSFDGLIWLDQGVIPNVIRMFDGSLYQPGGIAPRTGVSGLSKTGSGIILLDTFSGLAAGAHLTTHSPDQGGGSYVDLPAGTMGGAGSGGNAGLIAVTGSDPFENHVGLINGIGATNFMILWLIAQPTSVGSGGRHGLGMMYRYADSSHYGKFAYNYDPVGAGDKTGLGTDTSTAYSPGFVTGDTLRIVVNGTSITGWRNGTLLVSGTPNSAASGTTFGFWSYGPLDAAATATMDELIITDDVYLKVQGVRPGWAAKLFNASGVQIASGVESGTGSILLNLSSVGADLVVGGITGYVQLYTDNGFGTTIADGRYPSAGNASGIYPGDVLQWSF